MVPKRFGDFSEYWEVTGTPRESYVGEHSNFKIFLRTRKIMVMHSNERGEYDLRTLVDRNGSFDTT